MTKLINKEKDNKYIERQYLLDTIDAMIAYGKTPTDIYEMVEDATTIDIVRCKDCHWRTGLEEHTAWHPCDEMAVNDSWFCADGERRDDETD